MEINYEKLADLIADRILQKLNPPTDRIAELDEAARLIAMGKREAGQKLIRRKSA